MAEVVYPPVIIVLKSFWKYLGLQFHFEGDEKIPRKGGAILAMNHIGYLDFALIGTAALPTKRLVRFMAKKEIFNNKLAGPLMRGMHHINVDRDNGSASFVAAMRALRSGGWQPVARDPESVSMPWPRFCCDRPRVVLGKKTVRENRITSKFRPLQFRTG